VGIGFFLSRNALLNQANNFSFFAPELFTFATTFEKPTLLLHKFLIFKQLK